MLVSSIAKFTQTTTSALGDRLLATPSYLLDSANERSNFCTGGLEEGKVIIGERYLRNSFKETTVLGCQAVHIMTSVSD